MKWSQDLRDILFPCCFEIVCIQEWRPFRYNEFQATLKTSYKIYARAYVNIHGRYKNNVFGVDKTQIKAFFKANNRVRLNINELTSFAPYKKLIRIGKSIAVNRRVSTSSVHNVWIFSFSNFYFAASPKLWFYCSEITGTQ